MRNCNRQTTVLLIQTSVILGLMGSWDFHPRTGNAQPPARQSESPTVAFSLDERPDDLDAPFLRRPVHAHFVDLSLSDVVSQLSEQVGIPIILDRKALEASEMLTDEPITFSTELPGMRERVSELMAKEIPIEEWNGNLVMQLDQVLDLLTNHLEMKWFVQKGVLHLTTLEDARKRMINRSYSLTPFRSQRIADLTLSRTLALEPGTNFNFGNGELVTVGHILTLRESYSVQRKLRRLLQEIANPDPLRSGHYATQEARSREQLARPVNADFLETPLNDAIDILAYQSKGRIFFDTISFEEAGGLIDQPITLALKDRSLRQTLEIILQDLKLIVTVNAGELFITTNEVAREMWTSRIYDTRSVARTKEIRDSLVQAIMALTSGQWEDTDQGGSLIMLENGLLIAVTIGAVHDEIAELVDFYEHQLATPNLKSPQQLH